MDKFKSRDDQLRDENDRRLAHTCAEPGCAEPAVLSGGTSQRDKTWFCRWHFHNPGTPIPLEEFNSAPPDWRKQAMDDWFDGLTEAQSEALKRKDGEGRKAYASRMSEIQRRLAKRATTQLQERLPYDKHASVSGEAPSAEDREASLEQARAESETDISGR